MKYIIEVHGTFEWEVDDDEEWFEDQIYDNIMQSGGEMVLLECLNWKVEKQS